MECLTACFATPLAAEVVDNITYIDCQTTAKGADADSARIRALSKAMQDAQFQTGSAAVHFKGFGSGYIAGAELDGQIRLLIEHIRKGGYKSLVWDGDDYCATGFTGVLPRIRKELPQLRMGAVLLAKHREKRFHASWSVLTGDSEGHIGPFDCFLVDECVSEGGYEALGWLMLRATCAKKVLLLGGGAVVKGEYGLMQAAAEAGTHPQVDFKLFDVARVLATGEEQRSALLGVLPKA